MLRAILWAGAVVVGAVAGFRLVVAPWRKRWGVEPGEWTKVLPGDDVVSRGITAETRGISIDATPDEIWPWLVQMGYGRAGWYSYDQVDMNHPSARRILQEHQVLALGDVVPTHPGGGFVVKAVEAGHHLVLYIDTEIVREQADAAAAADPTPANLRMAGAFMEGAQPSEFAASWAFVLEDAGAGRTRLIERFRVRFGDDDRPWMRVSMPMMGFGVFLMMRKQLLGIRERVEQAELPVPIAAVA
jgi:hypothetical protein